MTGPLAGLLVVDASWGMPGAVASMFLADYGARVVKVERPGGAPDAGSPNRKVWDRGKWSTTADLGDPEASRAVRGLIDRADVFIESFRPGGAAKFGLDFDSIRRTNPHVAYCSISGYGQEGPWRDRPGYDSLVAARLGLMAEQPGHRPGPIFVGHPTVGYSTGFLAAIGVLSALQAVRATSSAQSVDVSLLDGLLSQAPIKWWWNDAGVSYLGDAGEGPTFGRTRMVVDMYECSDNEYLVLNTGGEGSFKRTMDALGLGANVRQIVGQPEMSVPLEDDEVPAVLRVPDVLRSMPRSHWLEVFGGLDTAVAPVLRPGEVLEDDQVRFAQVTVDIADEIHGSLRQMGPGLMFDRSPATVPTRAPALGEHNDRLIELTGRPRQLPSGDEGLGARGFALEGIRILDFSNFFAGAYGAKILADLGADVIKVESPAGDPMRGVPEPFEGCQRGKRMFALDLTSSQASDVVAALVRTADVVIHNLRPGKAEKLGIGYEDLRLVNPNLIYGYLPGYGATGPKSQMKSLAPLMTAITGLLYAAAGEGNPPVARACGNEDIYNGLQSAMAILLALEHRAQTGQGQYFESAQLHAAITAASEQCLDTAGELVTSWQLDHEQMGFGPLNRLYRTTDGWICLVALDASYQRLRHALDLEDELSAQLPTTAAERAHTAEALERRLGATSASSAYELLDAADVPCEIALEEPYMPTLWWDEWALESGRVFERYHPEWGWIREVGHVIRLPQMAQTYPQPNGRLGQHTGEILAELGVNIAQIDELLSGACRS